MPRSVKEWIGKNDDARPPKSVLVRLFEAAGGLCQKCGAKVKLGGWHADHTIRLRDGGGNRESNLQVLCVYCHRAKTGEENKAQAKATKIKAAYIGIPKKKTALSKREGWKFNWKTRRYERICPDES